MSAKGFITKNFDWLIMCLASFVVGVLLVTVLTALRPEGPPREGICCPVGYACISTDDLNECFK